MRLPVTRRASLPLALFAAAGAACCAFADNSPDAAMLRWPDVSQDRIVFSYANDLWVAPKTGGTALPLSSPRGQESFPKFSPDGKTIAFIGNYEGNRDVYTISTSGGVHTRVTHHPAGETLSDWAPQTFGSGSDLLVLSNGLSPMPRQTQMLAINSGGGLPARLPVPYSGFGAVSPDGVWLAYTPHSTDTRTWKRYRGGMATDIWLFNLKDNTSRRITDWEGTDTIPMWVPGGDGGIVYYLSDAGPEHRLNIWAYRVADGTREQVTRFTTDDVRWPSIGPGDNGEGEIVFQLGGQLRLLNLGTRQDKVVNIVIPGDRPTVSPRMVDAAKWVESASISPTGKRVAIEARGDIWSAPAKEGVVRALTRSDGVFERGPSWSPDGRWIAYFSDESGEYELWVRPGDAKPPEEKKSDDAKQSEKTEGEKIAASEDTGTPAAKAAPRKLTNLGAGFRMGTAWSPDSKHITFTDNAGNLHLVTPETGEAKVIDKDPWGNALSCNWSHDSQWLTYARSEENSNQNNNSIYIYNVKTGERTRVTSGQFSDGSPVFDRKGDFLYFASNRVISNPVYSDLDTTFAYTGTQALYMVPLRADVKNPWAPKSDEEEIKKEDKKEDAKKNGDKKEGDKANPEGDQKPDDKPKETKDESAKADDGISGSWTGTAMGNAQGMPPGGIPIGLKLTLNADGTLTGTLTSVMGGGAISDGTYDKSTGAITFSVNVGRGVCVMTGTVNGEEASGTWSVGGEASGTWTLKRTGKAEAGKDGEAKTGDSKDKPAKEVKIDFDGFEARAMQLPVPTGNFGGTAVSHDNKLIYTRYPVRFSDDGPGGGGASIKIFDPADDSKEEKTVITGGGGFDISADGKKLLVMRGGSNMTVCDAAAGGGKSSSVPTGGMTVRIDPRTEWKQILNDTWRLFRDYFYEPTMHGVDWPKVRDHYMTMIDDCASREDVAYVQAEMVSELNIGHAYINSPGDVENPVPSVSVGMLGCDFELVKGDEGTAYRIARVYQGGPWDVDARGPISRPNSGIKEGDFVLAINGVPIDTSRDPWAAFLGTADKTISLTVGPNPVIDGKAKEVLITPVGSEVNLRYRDWIEGRRKHVADKTGGKVGYIYVPNTGVDGQSDLFRQFQGERGRPALIIDERWNGGGQIPTRFIELLNRPTVSYWARRHGNDWPWPPDSHQGPKCMLANGLAGSGGDMFPWLFKLNNLGKVIGTRTWGGLVGISGNPGLIDGARISVPTFGIYEMDGTWAVEGHGVDPDIEVIDDPAKMVNGGDPQLDAAIEQMLKELAEKPFVKPQRPASPDRSGMGLPDKDK
ncbi:MAG: PD40 domain-containing protein [Phycisphaerae bacterium]|nr:PD40 domain-containing protein [Phycisphaerae bacterium]